jgi:uncharacterized protein (DUF1697 family)
MPRFVVLLRGVNVGKGNRLPMAEFRARLEALGHADVRTLLNSGNAVFSSPGRSADGHARAIHDALLERPGLDLHVVVVPSRTFSSIVEQNPLAPSEDVHSRLLVAFAQQPAAITALSALTPLVQPAERFFVGDHAAYLLCTDGIMTSKVATALLGKAGRAVTTRNWATVLKLNQMVAEKGA